MDRDAFERTRHHAVDRLLAERCEAGHWIGELAISALSTATAIVALRLVDRNLNQNTHDARVEAGAMWLVRTQNQDGGWGDTIKSHSNISTTMLVWGALGLAGVTGDPVERCEAWLKAKAGSLEPDKLTEAILQRYGKDRTFSVPIVMMAVLCGRLGDPDDPKVWRRVKQLPFELAAFPQSWFSKLNLRVVSYALPALIAIGHLRHTRAPSRNPFGRMARRLTRAKALKLLERIQPPNGGFLEATPLTSFVTMALAGAGLHDHAVARRAVAFLKRSMRDDGSWPIDTNLATWVTTLSVNALAAGGRLDEYLDEDERRAIRDWLLGQQYTEVHPYTNAAPGGWAWTDLPGGVPDADDTAGAVLAIHALDPGSPETDRAVANGCRWLLDLQNSDHGIPTFCRGWGRLPFDRSSTDITAHALRAWSIAVRRLGETRAPIDLDHASVYLEQAQRDGTWTPLWFGNQHVADESNPLYGTARVLNAIAEHGLALMGPWETSILLSPGTTWILNQQNQDGGWGGRRGAPSSIEETALAAEALASLLRSSDAATIWTESIPEDQRPFAKPLPDRHAVEQSLERGVAWIIEHTQEGTVFEPAPIGFYFAKLWYFEKLYPLIFTVGALQRVRAAFEHPSAPPALET